MCVYLDINGVYTRPYYQKLNVPYRKTNVGQKALSFVDASLWNNLNKTLKASSGLNVFKHNIKQHYFNELKNKSSNSSFCTFDASK